MNKRIRIVTIILALAVVFTLAGFAAQQAATSQKKTAENTEEMVVCPVSGETMKKSEAPASWEYKGKTYYFCCQNCKDKFMKDPESFLKEKPAGAAETKGGMMQHEKMMKDKGMMKGAQECGCEMMMGRGQMMNREGANPMMRGGGMMGGMGMMWENIDLKVENIKDGVVVTVTSTDPHIVKMIQDHADWIKEARLHRKAMMTQAPQQEPKKEPAKK